MTSLSEQLKRLAVPQTSLLKQDKKKPSLLFDPKEAASLNRDTVYQIGLDGLEGLKSKNSIFAQYENNLFHYMSKDFERAVQTAEANEKLNKTIAKFLLHLSPYFMLYDSYKALEWLIHRYCIHEYNKEELLLLILPYHETNIFARTLQLINLNEPNDKWYWLHSLQKPGVHLPKDALYNHAANDAYFLKLISKYINTIVKEHENPNFLTVVFNFYCATFVGALTHAKEINENHVTQMLTSLLKGLKSEVADFCASSYVITAQLVSKTDLSAKLLLKIIDNITTFPVDSLRNEAIALLVIIYQYQKDFNEMSEESLRRICETGWISKVLQQFDEDGMHVLSFLETLLKEAIKYAIISEDNIYQEFIINLLNDLKLDLPVVSQLISILLDAYSPKKKHSEEVSDWVRSLMNLLENQYPAAYDEVMNTIMKYTPGEKLNRKQKSVQKILKLSVDKGNYCLYDKLFSTLSEVRKETIKFMCENFASLKDREKDLLRSVLLSRLSEDNFETVYETFRSSMTHINDVLESSQVQTICSKVLNKAQTNKSVWWKISYNAASVLVKNSDPFDIKVFITLLPFLLPTHEDECRAAKAIVNSTYGKKCPYLSSKVDILQNAPFHKFFTIVFDSLSLNENLPDIKDVIAALNSVPIEETDVLYKYISTLLLSSTLPENCPADVASQVLDILLTYLEKSNLRSVKKEPSITNYIIMARNNKFPLEGFLQCLETLFVKTQVPNKPLGHLDFYIENEISKFYLVIMNILITGTFSEKQRVALKYEESLNKFFDRFAKSVHLQIDAYLNVATSESKYVNTELQVQCLNKILKFLRGDIVDIAACLDCKNLTVPYILIILCNPALEIREGALEILKMLSMLGNDKSVNYLPLVKRILTFKEEIILDQEQVPAIMKNIESSDSSKVSNLFNTMVNLIKSNSTPIYLTSGLCKILSLISNYNILSSTITVANTILANAGESELNLQCSKIVFYNLIKFTSDIGKYINAQGDVWSFITSCLLNQKLCVNLDDVKYSLSALMLQQVDKEFFCSLNTNVQKSLLNAIINVATNIQDPEILSYTNQVLKKIDLDLNIVLDHLTNMKNVQSPKLSESKKKRRITIIPTADILDTDDWKKGVTVLEFIQDKKKIRNTEVLLPVLFDLLKKCLDFDEQDNVEYVKQLILGSILHCSEKCETNIPQNIFNMELVARCITASKNPQTHHHALLLLAQAALIVPQQVLHHIMTNFTFVGSPVLRHDDAYSFQIITKIIDTIIPLLIKDGDEASVCHVLRVFVDAILDVPEHRRIMLYKQLLTQVNPNEHLHTFLLLLFEAHVVHSINEKQNKPQGHVDNVPKRLDIASELCREFKPEVVITNCIKLLEYLSNLPADKSEYQESKHKNILFDIKKHTPKQLRHYKYTMLMFINNLLSSKEFVYLVAKLPNETLVKLEDQFKSVILGILSYIQSVSKIATKNQNTPQAQYWKVMLHISFDILDSINALLTPQMFLLVVRGLSEHDILNVRKRVLELLNSKLQHDNEFFENCEESELIAVLPNIIKIIRLLEAHELQQDEAPIVQTALFSLQVLSKKLASNNTEKFVQILDLISNFLKVPQVQGNVMASLILCLAEICNNLRAHSIASLNKFMPTIIKILKSQDFKDSTDSLLSSIVTAINIILDCLSLFLSPFLEKLLVEISSLIANLKLNDTDQKSNSVIVKLGNIKQKLGVLIPARVLIPAIEQSYNTLINKSNFASIGPLMEIFSENINNLNNQDIQANLPELTSFFLNTLQFRVDISASLEQANEVEGHIIDALTTLILKLSETSFRPLYYKLYDWVRSEVKSERVITFYSLSNGVAQKLKSLFVLFAGYFLNNAALLLDACNVIKSEELYFNENEKNILLLEYILKTLTSVFMNDTQKFVNKERFELLMQPIVDQLENTLGGEDVFETRVKEVIIPCIVNFAVATADDALWKQMNYQILLKMRHNSAKIRLVALEALIETAKKLGEDFLPLLPETIPFLAELLEDEDEVVEKAARKAVQDLEKVVGEPLEKYF